MIIQRENQLQTLYGHLSKINVKENQHIELGHIVGELGSTGRSTGPHLHYEIINNNEKIIPQDFFKSISMFNKSTTKNKTKNFNNLPIDTVIADGILIKGDVIGEGAIRIDDRVEGNVDLNKGVILGEKAEVIGSVKSNEVVIYGKLNGDLECEDFYINETGRIDGNMLVNRFSVEMGGKYNGNLKMTTNEIQLNENVEKNKLRTQS